MQTRAQIITEELKKAIVDENEAAIKSCAIDLGVFVIDAFVRYAEGINRLATALESHNVIASEVHKARLAAGKK